MRMLRYCARVFVSLSDRGARALVCLHQGVHGFRHRGLTCRPVAQHIPRCPSDPIRPWRPGLGGHVRGAGGRARRALPGHRGAAPAAAHVRAGWRRIRTAGGRRRGRGRVPRRWRCRLRPGGCGRAWVGCARAPSMRRPCAAAPCAQCYGWPCARGVHHRLQCVQSDMRNRAVGVCKPKRQRGSAACAGGAHAGPSARTPA